MSKASAYAKGTFWFLAVSIGGPAMTYYMRPSDKEIFDKFSPELKQQNLENRDRREKEFDEFVTKLKEYSKSDKPIWVVAAQEEKKRKAEAAEAARARLLEESKIRDELQALKRS